MRLISFGAALLLASGIAYGQKTEVFVEGGPTGTITDGAASFAYNGIGAGGAANADFTGVTPGGDQIFSLWWYYRVSGDTQEFPFPVPTTEDYTGNIATLDWADVDGRGFAASLVNVIADGGGPSGTLTSALTVTNNGSTPLTIDIFWYVDADVAGSAGGDSAVLTTDPSVIDIDDTGETLQVLAGGNDFYQVAAWPAIRDLLSDTALDNLDNSGLPFGPDDYTSGMQWTSVTIDPGASESFQGNLGSNAAAPPVVVGPPVQVPALNLTGLILLALALTVLTWFGLRRRV